MRTTKTIHLFLMILFAGAAVAAPPAPPAPEASVAQGGTGGQLSALQAQIPLWEVRAKIAKLQAEVKNADKDQSPGAAAGWFPGTAPSTAQAHTAPSAALGPMRAASMHLESVTAYNGRYAALIDVNGTGIEVRQGDELAGGWVVARITDNAVELSRGKHSRILRL